MNWKPEAVLLDAMVFVRSAPIRTHHKTFSDYAKSFVEKYIIPHTKKPSTRGVHVLFDQYTDELSLKSIERARRDKKVKHLVTTYSTIKGNDALPKETWSDFLCNRTKKKKPGKISQYRNTQYCSFFPK